MVDDHDDYKATIVTTAYISNSVDDGLIVVDSFIQYHLSIGFTHIIIFWDDPNINKNVRASLYLDKIQQYYTTRRVTVIYRHQQLLDFYQKYCTKYQELLPFMDNEVQARQTLNAELALRLVERGNRNDAKAIGINIYNDNDNDDNNNDNDMHWLLHIDIDEIFYYNNDNVCDHFKYLDSLNIDSMTYMNHEGCPEVHDSNDYFLTTKLFRRHHFSLPITAAVEDALAYWKTRNQYSQYFLVYDNGKSAVKVNINAVPKDVHRWHSSSNFNRKTAIADPRNLCINELLLLNDGPCILHYVTCGYRWLTDKYTILGNFPDYWFGGLLPIAPSFHLKSRDIVNKSDLAKEYYRKEIKFSVDTFDNDKTLYEQEYQRQLDSQVLMRITKVSDIIKKDRDERCKVLGIQCNDNCDNEIVNNPIVSPPVPPEPIANHPVNDNVAEMDKLRILSQISQMWF